MDEICQVGTINYREENDYEQELGLRERSRHNPNHRRFGRPVTGKGGSFLQERRVTILTLSTLRYSYYRGATNRPTVALSDYDQHLSAHTGDSAG